MPRLRLINALAKQLEAELTRPFSAVGANFMSLFPFGGRLLLYTIHSPKVDVMSAMHSILVRALFMSAFRGKADMAFCGNPLLRSLFGVKRTSLFAAQMSAFDPKRT